MSSWHTRQQLSPLASSVVPTESAIGRKRKRLTHACKSCRTRKVKCDERNPSCTNCLKAGIECLTTDPRSGAPAERREAQRPPLDLASPSNSISTTSPTPVESSNKHEQITHPVSPESPTGRPVANALPISSIQEVLSDGRLPVLPRFSGGNSLHVLTQWLDLAFARLGVPQRFTSSNTAASQHPPGSSKFTSAPDQNHQRLPSRFDPAECAKAFNASTNIIYPVFDEHSVLGVLQRYAEHFSLQDPSSGLAIFYMILAIVNANDRHRDPEFISQCIRSAFSQLSIIVAEASLRSIQALFLMVLILRGHDQIEVAWHLCTLAVSMAQSIGIHRASTGYGAEAGSVFQEERIRTWWALYCIDKVLSLEIERPSSIRDTECNQQLPNEAMLAATTSRPDLFKYLIALSKIQSQISERCNRSRSYEEGASQDLENIIRDKIQTAGDLDQILLIWVENLPTDLRRVSHFTMGAIANLSRPSEFMFCDPILLQFVSFLAIQYQQTMLLLHRNAFIVNNQIVQKEIDIYCAGKPYHRRLRNGQIICSDAARSIINILDHLCESKGWSVLNTINAPLLSTYALAIRIIKNPSSRSSRADLELLTGAIHFVGKQRAFVDDKDTTLSSMLSTLREQVTVRVEAVSPIEKKHPQRQYTVSDAALNLNGGTMSSHTFDGNSNGQALSLTDLPPTYSTARAVPGEYQQQMNSILFSDPTSFASSAQDPQVLGSWTWNGTIWDWDTFALAFDLPS